MPKPGRRQIVLAAGGALALLLLALVPLLLVSRIPTTQNRPGAGAAPVPPAATPLAPAAMAQLRSLGYIGGPAPAPAAAPASAPTSQPAPTGPSDPNAGSDKPNP
jgi:hypothetical protein